jgi:hypothetical protein
MHCAGFAVEHLVFLFLFFPVCLQTGAVYILIKKSAHFLHDKSAGQALPVMYIITYVLHCQHTGGKKFKNF